MLVFSIAIAKTVQISSSTPLYFDSDSEFGFDSGATAQITITGASNLTVFGLIPEHLAPQYYYTAPDSEQHCFGNSTFSDLQILAPAPSPTLMATVSARDVYVPFFFSCEGESFALSATYFFRNPSGHLDYRWRPSLKIYPAFIGISVLSVLVWLANWGMHFLQWCGLHLCTTVSLAALLAENCLLWNLLRTEDSEGVVRMSVRVPTTIVVGICRMFFLLTILLGGHGWCLGRRRVRFCAMIPGIVGALGFVSGRHAMEYRSLLDPVGVALSVLEVLSLFLFIHSLARALREADGLALEFFVGLQENGVDAGETPAYVKYRRIVVYQRALTIYSVLLVFAVIFDLFLALVFWLGPFMFSLVNWGLGVVMIIILSLRADRMSVYFFMEQERPTVVVQPHPIPLAEVEVEVDDLDAPKELDVIQNPPPETADREPQNPYDAPDL
jgi:hypothetical protein